VFIDDDMVAGFLHAVTTVLMPQQRHHEAIAMLSALTQVPRFELIVAFLPATLSTEMKSIVSGLEGAGFGADATRLARAFEL